MAHGCYLGHSRSARDCAAYLPWRNWHKSDHCQHRFVTSLTRPLTYSDRLLDNPRPLRVDLRRLLSLPRRPLSLPRRPAYPPPHPIIQRRLRGLHRLNMDRYVSLVSVLHDADLNYPSVWWHRLQVPTCLLLFALLIIPPLSGPTTCASPSTCKYSNAYYSQVFQTRGHDSMILTYYLSACDFDCSPNNWDPLFAETALCKRSHAVSFLHARVRLPLPRRLRSLPGDAWLH